MGFLGVNLDCSGVLIRESSAIPWQQFFWLCQWNLVVKQNACADVIEEEITNFSNLYALFL